MRRMKRRQNLTRNTFHTYSFSNVLLILAQRGDEPTTRVAGLKTWNQLGRHVVKGQRALWILAPVFPMKDKDQSEKAGTERDADEAGEAERRPVFFRAVPVFAFEQTDGEELPEPVRHLDGDTAGDLFDRLAKFSESEGCPVTVEAIPGGVNGYFSPAQHRIVIRTGLAPDQACKTLAHEITHSILHRDPEVYAAHRGDCELEAESAAFVVLHHHGIDAGSYSFGYVAGWAGGDEEAVKGIKSSAQRIQSTAKRILDGIATETEVPVEALAK